VGRGWEGMGKAGKSRDGEEDEWGPNMKRRFS